MVYTTTATVGYSSFTINLHWGLENYPHPLCSGIARGWERATTPLLNLYYTQLRLVYLVI